MIFDAVNIDYRGPPLPMAGVMDFAHIKIIKFERHIKKNRYIGNFMYMSFCILCSVFCVLPVRKVTLQVYLLFPPHPLPQR